jgi:hypothetical protein
MTSVNEFLLLFLLGFALHEYCLRRYFMAKKKWWIQGMSLFFVEIVMTAKYLSWQSLFVIMGFVFIYLVFSKIVPTKNEKYALEQFLLKNIVILFLLVVVQKLAFGVTANNVFNDIWNYLFGITIGNSKKVLVYGIGYFFVMDGGTTIIKGLLNKIPVIMANALSPKEGTAEIKNNDRTIELKYAGEMIGILERLLILTFVLAGSYEAVAFSVAAKSIARYKELDYKNFAEYYLLGTLASVGIAVIVGAIVKYLTT